MAEGADGLSWDDFRLIGAVAETHGLAGAAGRLGLNHSTVFRRLGAIEAALGVALFERRRDGYVPTPAGEEMAAVAGRIADDVVDFARKVAGRQPAPSGELRVTTNDSLLLHLLMPMFVRFRAACPEVRLDVVTSNPALNLSRRDADVAIRATDRPPDTLVGRRVARIAWALYGRRGEGEGTEGRDWVLPGDDIAALPVAAAARAIVPPGRVACRLNTVTGLAGAVSAGIGIGHLPCFVADRDPWLVRLAPPDPAHAADLWLLTHPDLRQSPRVRVFMEAMGTEIGRQRAALAGEASANP
jgi:DNA-binding transcriptional LysR family regulator